MLVARLYKTAARPLPILLEFEDKSRLGCFLNQPDVEAVAAVLDANPDLFAAQ
jgi:hypothetical protein